MQSIYSILRSLCMTSIIYALTGCLKYQTNLIVLWKVAHVAYSLKSFIKHCDIDILLPAVNLNDSMWHPTQFSSLAWLTKLKQRCFLTISHFPSPLHVGSAARYHFLACSFFSPLFFLVSRPFEEVAQRQRRAKMKTQKDNLLTVLTDTSVMDFKYLRDRLSKRLII